MREEASGGRKAVLGTGDKSPLLVIREGRSCASRCLVVLGVERGGTSMVAGVLRALGVEMGERAGLNHEDPKFLGNNIDKLREEIELRNRKYSLWGVKVPQLVTHMGALHEAFVNPHYLFVTRNIGAVSESWMRRSAGDYLGVADRTIEYYGRAVEFLRSVESPAAIVNYERACADKETFVRQVAEFVGLSPDEALQRRASEMITGDGKGYVNLPEHHFAVERLDRTSPWRLGRRVRVQVVVPDVRTDRNQRMVLEKQQDRIIVSSEDGAPFAKRFALSFILDASPSAIHGEKVRLYFDFVGDFFPGHATRPKLVSGVNHLSVESNGKVRRLAIGGTEPIALSISRVQIHELASGGGRVRTPKGYGLANISLLWKWICGACSRTVERVGQAVRGRVARG